MHRFTHHIVSLRAFETHPGLSDRLPGMAPQAIYQSVVQSYAPQLRLDPVPHLIQQAASTLLDAEGATTVSALAFELGCSRRHLQKIFRRHVGLSPKQLSLIIRLCAAVDEMARTAPDGLTMAGLALASHFYDQAHFIKAFRSFAKMSPKKINIPDYFLSLKK